MQVLQLHFGKLCSEWLSILQQHVTRRDIPQDKKKTKQNSVINRAWMLRFAASFQCTQVSLLTLTVSHRGNRHVLPIVRNLPLQCLSRL